ncbi:MAG: stage 0 sporulation family protein [Sphaerochaetaceae bacterium]
MKKERNRNDGYRADNGQNHGRRHGDTGYIYLIKNPSSNELSVCASEVPLKRGVEVVAPTRYGLDYGVVVGSAMSLSGGYQSGSTECQGACLQAVDADGEEADGDLLASGDPSDLGGEPVTVPPTTTSAEDLSPSSLKGVEEAVGESVGEGVSVGEDVSEAVGVSEGVVPAVDPNLPPYIAAGITYEATLGTSPQIACSECTACQGCGSTASPETRVELEGDVEWIDRIATDEDIKRFSDYLTMENEALLLCREKVQSHGLDMKLVTAHYLLGEPKIIFFFTAANRVDFRDLVKDLVSVFRIRIELRQIGVRDESRVLGGLAVCGRDFCCHCVTDKLNPVSIKMAKEQNLSLNSTKISGPCGRLLCCLSYEYDFYAEEKAKLPPEGSRMKVAHDLMKITEVNILSRKISMIGAEGRFLTIPFSAVYFNEETSHWEIGKDYLDEYLSS